MFRGDVVVHALEIVGSETAVDALQLAETITSDQMTRDWSFVRCHATFQALRREALLVGTQMLLERGEDEKSLSADLSGGKN